MATPQTPYDAVLHAARDVTKLESALDAEMLGSALLGSVYAIAETDRDTAVREFVDRVPRRHRPPPDRGGDHHPAGLRHPRPGRRGRRAGPSRRPGARLGGSARPGPPHRHAGRTATSTATRPPTSPPSRTTTRHGGPEHALVALVDHNIGITKDIFVGGPAERILDQVRADVRRRRADLVPRPRTRPGCGARWPAISRSPTT